MLLKICETTRQRVEFRKRLRTSKEILDAAKEARTPFDFSEGLKNSSVRAHIIAEIKRASPSRGPINTHADPVETARLYLNNGAYALSVLTEPEFFKGDITDLTAIRKSFPNARLLMKDFIIDHYQIAEARVCGADAILLIVGALSPLQLSEFVDHARVQGLSALVEVHKEDELMTAVEAGATLIGVNNRDLHTMTIDLTTSEHLIKQIPSSAIAISESGIETPIQINALRALGFDGFLVGSALMATRNPGQALSSLLGGSHEN